MEFRDAAGEVHEMDGDLNGIELDERAGRVWIDGRLAHATKVGDTWWVHLDGRIHNLTLLEHGAAGAGEDAGMTAPMPGKVLEVLCEVGQTVEEGEALIVMEAMKMEHRIAANRAGQVAAIHFQAGEQVDAGATLIDIESDEDSN